MSGEESHGVSMGTRGRGVPCPESDSAGHRCDRWAGGRRARQPRSGCLGDCSRQFWTAYLHYEPGWRVSRRRPSAGTSVASITRLRERPRSSALLTVPCAPVRHTRRSGLVSNFPDPIPGVLMASWPRPMVRCSSSATTAGCRRSPTSVVRDQPLPLHRRVSKRPGRPSRTSKTARPSNSGSCARETEPAGLAARAAQHGLTSLTQ